MIKRISISGFTVAALFILMSAVNKPASSGAPSASTGAPDEQTCAMSTCHDDNSLNSGSAKLSIEVGEFGENKFPGLPIKIKITDPGKIRFGFEVTALDESNKKIGRFIISDSIRTQIIGGKVGLPDRDYLTYTYYGTLSSKTGEAEWEANWEPAGVTKPGKVRFYVAAVSANNNGEDKGDFVYTTEAGASWETTLNKNNQVRRPNVNVAISKTGLTILNPEYTYIKTISITDLSGRTILTRILKNSEAKTEINLPEISTGVVVASIETSSGTITKKLFFTND